MRRDTSFAPFLLLLSAPWWGAFAQEGRVSQVTATTHSSPTRADAGHTTQVASWHRRPSFRPDGGALLLQEMTPFGCVYNPSPTSFPRLVGPLARGLSQVAAPAGEGAIEEDWQFYPDLAPASPLGLMPRYDRSGSGVFFLSKRASTGMAGLHLVSLSSGRLPIEIDAQEPALNERDAEGLDLYTLWYVVSPANDEVFFLAQAHEGGVPRYMGVYRLDLGSGATALLSRIDKTIDLSQFAQLDGLDDLQAMSIDASMAISPDGEIVALACGSAASTELRLIRRDGGESFQATLPAGMLNLFMEDMAFLEDGRRLALAMHLSGVSFLQVVEVGSPLSTSSPGVARLVVNRGTPFHVILGLAPLAEGRVLLSLVSLYAETTPDGAKKASLRNDLVAVEAVDAGDREFLEPAAVVVSGEAVDLDIPVTLDELVAAIRHALDTQDLSEIRAVVEELGAALVTALKTMKVKIDLAATANGPRAAYAEIDAARPQETHVFQVELPAELGLGDRVDEAAVGFGDLGGEYNLDGNVELFGKTGQSSPVLGWTSLAWSSYNALSGETHVAAGDVDGDGRDELVIGVGRGGSGWIEVRDDLAHGCDHLAWKRLGWSAYEAANGAVYPACGDVDGDGLDEIVIGLGVGGGGWIFVQDDARMGFLPLGSQRVRWNAYDVADGNTRPACGDLDGDGNDEVVVGLGRTGQGWLEVFDGVDGLFAHRAWVRTASSSYNAGASAPTRPACGNLDGDARDEVVVGLGASAGGALEVKDDLAAGLASLRWLAPRSGSLETRPALGDFDGDGLDEVLVGYGLGGGGLVDVLDDGVRGCPLLMTLTAGSDGYRAANGETFPTAGDFK